MKECIKKKKLDYHNFPDSSPFKKAIDSLSRVII